MNIFGWNKKSTLSVESYLKKKKLIKSQLDPLQLELAELEKNRPPERYEVIYRYPSTYHSLYSGESEMKRFYTRKKVREFIRTLSGTASIKVVKVIASNNAK